ncbi:hypothetical protein PR202_ga30423 [Eleusine coracana subsp. coracana]|uniref:Uncharacterized protein n=1 Tax=Eleusine coracana subsp. coracana TaxID=191504 RepID=A0AAV5DNU8_ELECO|nr:hypothetical protein PR202_ga30423 [Eleusine coracana subsp. coracana]
MSRKTEAAMSVWRWGVQQCSCQRQLRQPVATTTTMGAAASPLAIARARQPGGEEDGRGETRHAAVVRLSLMAVAVAMATTTKEVAVFQVKLRVSSCKAVVSAMEGSFPPGGGEDDGSSTLTPAMANVLQTGSFANCELRSMVLVDRSMLGSHSPSFNYPGKIPPGLDLPSDVTDKKLVEGTHND